MAAILGSGPVLAIQNSATGSSNGFVLDTTQATVTLTRNVAGADTDLVVTHVVDNATPNEGDTVRFTITLTNNGPVTVTNATIDDVLPAELILVSATPSQGTFTDPTWSVGSINVAASATLDIQATVGPNTAGSVITSTVSNLILDQIDNNVTADDVSEAITVGSDAVAPAAITDLAATNRSDTSVTLSWSAPGDNDSLGAAASYDLRYATAPIDAANWASATPVPGEPVPAIAGSSETITVSGLNANTTYYFAIVSSDEVPNVSSLSNVLAVRTFGAAVTSAVAEIVPDALAMGSSTNAISYYVLPTVNSGNGDSGVNHVALTPPVEITSINVNAVSIAGVGSLTANCPASGNQYCVSVVAGAINVELGLNAGNSETIRIDMTADAPATAGSYSFSAMVDDTATASFGAQAVASGNADGNAANSNAQMINVVGLAVTSVVAEISPVFSRVNQLTNYVLDILPNIDSANGDTGVNRVMVQIPAGFSNPVINNVLVNGAVVTYTNSSSGLLLDLELAGKLTSSQPIQLQFATTAPAATGAYLFDVWVDDSTTPGIAPQAVMAGDANMVAGDSDTLTAQVETSTDSSNSTVSVDPQIVVADGGSAGVINIILLDSNSDPKPGRTVSVSSSRQSSITTETIVQPLAPTDASGQTSASISSTTPGVSTIYVRDVLDNVTLAQQPQVYFTQGQVLELTLTSNKQEVSTGDVVTYFVEIRNQGTTDVVDVTINNTIPAYFKYLASSAMLDTNMPITPEKSARALQFNVGTIPALVDANANGRADAGEAGYVRLSYQMVVGSGAQPGDYVNRAQAVDACDLCYISNVDEVRLRVDLDPLFDLGTIIGKVFEDRNNNGRQDEGETGIANAMLVLDDGTIATTDEYGRYHIPAVNPGQRAIKINLPTIDDLAVTDLQTQIIDVTPGLLAKANFGVNYAYEEASIGRKARYGVRVSGEQLNQPAQIQGNVKTLSLLVNGKMASFANSSVKLSVDELDDVVVIFGGRLKDPIRFATSTQYPEQVKLWELDIYGEDNVIVHTLSGEGAPPATIEWDGKAYDGKLILEQGIYQYKLTLMNKDGTNYTSARRNFGINRQTAIALNLTGDAFEAGSMDLGNKARAILKNAAEILRQYPDETVFVEGHTDNTGSAQANMQLSLDRANAAVSYLVDIEKLPRRQFIVKGYADQRPIADNDSPDGRELNRRIEISGTVTQVDRTRLLDQYRQRPSVRINNVLVTVDPYGRFIYEAPDNATQQLDVEIASVNGKSLSTQITLPGLEITDPGATSVLTYGAADGRHEAYNENEEPDLTDNGSAVTYLLSARTEPGNEVLFEGLPQKVRDTGKFNTLLHLDIGKNVFNFVVTTPQGYSKVVQLEVMVSDKNQDGSRIIAVNRIPSLSVLLPARGKQLTSKEFMVTGVTEPGNSLQVNGIATEVGSDGRFSTKINLEKGANLVIIAATDAEGNTGVLSREIEVVDEELFLLAFADGKVSKLHSSGYLENVNGGKQDGYYTQGRVAYYLRGTIAGKYLIRSAYDSQQQELDQLFDNISEKGNEHLLRNIDPDKIYPVYGDNSSVSYDGQNQGKFYLAVQSDELDALIGSYQLSLSDTELARYQRTLYGARVAYQSVSKTRYGAPDTRLTVFGAETRQVHIHDEVRATGGSLYYLSRSDIIEGSEQVSIIVRDKDTGLTLSQVTQVQNTDYSIKYDLGRIMFNRPISSVSDDNGLFNESVLAGHPVYIAISYEAETTSFENTTAGGYVRQQLGDNVALGMTYVDDQLATNQYELQGVDAEVRLGKHTRITAEVAESQGSEGITYISNDGGLSYVESVNNGVQKGSAWKAAAELDIGEMLGTGFGLNVGGYVKQLEPQFSSISTASESGTRKAGVNVGVRPGKADYITLNYYQEDPVGDESLLAGGSQRESVLTDIQWKHQGERWSITSGYQARESRIAAGEQEDSSLGALELSWQPTDDLATSIKHQQALSGPDNDQTSLGVGYRITPAIGVDGSVTHGSLGDAAEASLNFHTGNTRLYLTERVRSDSLTHSATTVTGAETSASRNTKVYTEYQREQASQQDRNVAVVGTRSNWTIDEGFNIRLSGEYGYTDTGGDAGTNHYALAIGLSYRHPSGWSLSSRDEVRRQWGYIDILQFVTSNLAEYKLNPDYSVLGKFNYSRSTNDDTEQTVAEYTEKSIGLAYRPTASDVFNALGRFTVIDDSRPVLSDSALMQKTRLDVFSIEWSWELNQYIEWVDKEAIKVKQEAIAGLPDARTTTFLSIHRLNFRLWKHFDWGVEYRSLRQEESDDARNGWLTELAWRANRFTRLGIGYNFTDFSDNEFSDNDYSVKGFYLRLQAVY
jgi:uncharacterized repeat protein (TIGR01451 family)